MTVIRKMQIEYLKEKEITIKNVIITLL
jgi:hypothetical protein